MNIILKLNGLNCSHCAESIRNKSSEIDGVKLSDLNFVTKKLEIEIDRDRDYTRVLNEVKALVKNIEPGVEIVELGAAKAESLMELELENLNCSDCAEKIRKGVLELSGVSHADFNLATKKFRIGFENSRDRKDLLEDVEKIIHKLEPGVEIIELEKSALRNEVLNLRLDKLNCSDCASKIEKQISKLDYVESVNFDFLSKKMRIVLNGSLKKSLAKGKISQLINKIEPDVEIIDMDSKNKSRPKEDKGFWSKARAYNLFTIIPAIVLALLPSILSLGSKGRFVFFILSYIIIGHKVIIQAVKNTLGGIPFDENFLMTIATLGAFVLGEYPEAVMVMLLYQIGETLQGIAVNHSRDSITSLMDIRPDYANLKLENEVVVVDPNEVQIGDIILVKPGERVALDGVLVAGSSSLDTSSITGESVPRSVKPGDEVYSGVVNLQGLLEIEVTKEFGESTISQVLDLVENASSQKAETENFITRFARYYTPVVVIIALIMALIMPVITGGDFGSWIYNACVFLVISCPCALVISVPLGFFGGLGGASKKGVLVKGSNYLDGLRHIDTLVFDKTGTITEGVFDVTEIESYSGFTKDQVLELAAYGESYSNHPIATSILKKYQGKLDMERLKDYRDISGKGIQVYIDGKKLLLGNKALLRSENIDLTLTDSIGTVVYIGLDDLHIGTIVVSDRIKADVESELRDLKDLGIEKMVMLSGDNQRTVEKVGKLVGMTEFYGDLLPQDKVAKFEEILKTGSKDRKIGFVGDGVNDAPVLARADIGIAMGALGSDAAIEASDVVIMTDNIGKIGTGIRISKNTSKIVRQNIILALGVKAVVLALGAFGKATMWQAVFADVGVSIIAILNSIRALKVDDL